MQIEINQSTLNIGHQKVFVEHLSFVMSLPGAVHRRVPVPSLEWSAPTALQSFKLQASSECRGGIFDSDLNERSMEGFLKEVLSKLRPVG